MSRPSPADRPESPSRPSPADRLSPAGRADSPGRAGPVSHPLSPERVRADVAELLGCDPADIGPDDDLFDRGLDSMRVMTLVERWRAAGASTLEFPDLAERAELAHWTVLVTERAG